MPARLKVTAAVVLVLAASAALLLLSGGHGPDRTRQAPPSAAAFIDSIGVNTHFNYVDTAYARRAEVHRRLRELGVRHIRDGVPVNAPALAAGLRGAKALGIRLTLGAGDIKLKPSSAVRLAVREAGSSIEALEAPNELDSSGLPDWREKLRLQMDALRRAGREVAPRVPVLGPSFVSPSNYRGVLASTFDLGNLHPYSGGLPPEDALEADLARGRLAGVRAPFVFTESGYHNAVAASVGQPPASELAAATYMPRVLLRAFSLGVRRTFIYELLDEKPDPGRVDPEQNFGLLRQDLTRKPAFAAVRNLIAAVRRSPGPATRPAPGASVTPGPQLERVDLQRADGSRVLALWRPVSVWDRDARRDTPVAPVPVELSWPSPARDLTVHRPTVSADRAAARQDAGKTRLQIAGDVVLLSYR